MLGVFFMTTLVEFPFSRIIYRVFQKANVDLINWVPLTLEEYLPPYTIHQIEDEAHCSTLVFAAFYLL